MDGDLVLRFDALRATRKLDVRDAAAALKVPEARLFAAHTNPDRVRLSEDWKGLLEALPQLGLLQFHVDGKLGVHRVEATIQSVRVGPTAAVLQGDSVDLRLLLSRWNTAWAVMHDRDGFAELGIHIHDPHGDPVLRIVQTLRTQRKALQGLVTQLRAPHQGAPLPLTRPPSVPSQTGIDPRTRRQVLAAWPYLKTMHDFGMLMRRHGLRRPEVYTILGPARAERVSFGVVRALLEHCVQHEVPIALSMGNRACVQSHRGTIDHLSHPAGWLNLRDPSAFIHIDPRAVHSTWMVQRPCVGGTHFQLELLGPGGDLLGSIRSARTERQSEDWRWRRAVNSHLREARKHPRPHR